MSTEVTTTGGTNSASEDTPQGDRRLFSAEIRAATAYADAMADASALSTAEHDAVIDALQQIESEYQKGTFAPADQDIFAAVQQRVDTIAGAAAGKFSAARGRNERISAALRLWLLEEMESLGEVIAELQRALIQQAEGNVATLMPGYIDFQPAQVISCSHWLLSYFWMLTRDQERLTAVIGRTSLSPLGSGPLAGTPYRIDRRVLAQNIGFGGVIENSIDAVSDMDFAAEFLFFAAMMGVHLSRLAEDLLLYNSPTLGFLSIDARYVSGILQAPPGKDSETIERSRSKSGRLLGNLSGFLSTLKGLPSVYSQDAPGNRQALFEAIDLLRAMISTLQSAVGSMTIHPDRMWDALQEYILAGDLIDYLVGHAVAYPDACRVVRDLLEKAAQGNTPISEMELADLQAASPAFTADVFALFDYSQSAAQRATIGGTAPAAVRAQIRQAFAWLTEAGLE